MANMNQLRAVAVCSLSVKRKMSSTAATRTVSAPATLHDVHEHEYDSGRI